VPVVPWSMAKIKFLMASHYSTNVAKVISWTNRGLPSITGGAIIGPLGDRPIAAGNRRWRADE
jgi:hypothetical protein